VQVHGAYEVFFRYRSHYRKPLIFKKNLALPSATWSTCSTQQICLLQAIVSVVMLTSRLQPNVSDKMEGLKNTGWKEDRSAGQDTFLFIKYCSLGLQIDQIGLGFIFPRIVSYVGQSNTQQASCTQSNKMLKDRTCRYLHAWDSSGPFRGSNRH